MRYSGDGVYDERLYEWSAPFMLAQCCLSMSMLLSFAGNDCVPDF